MLIKLFRGARQHEYQASQQIDGRKKSEKNGDHASPFRASVRASLTAPSVPGFIVILRTMLRALTKSAQV
jgi:hypothetical protein